MRPFSATAARRRRVVRRSVVGVAGFVLWAVVPALPAGGATLSPLPASGVSTPDGSWSTVPMGQVSDQSNTFWELFHTAPGSSRWTLVTPEGTADNGGLVAGVSGDSIAAGVLPSALLRFSPLSSSADGGASWTPVFLPGALATAGRRSGDSGVRHARRAGGHARRHGHGGDQEPRFLGAPGLGRRAPQGRALLCCLGDRRRDVLGGRCSTCRHRLRAWWTGGPVQPERRVVAPDGTRLARRSRRGGNGGLAAGDVQRVDDAARHGGRAGPSSARRRVDAG